MEKVKLTQEQKDRIDFVLSDWEVGNDSTIEEKMLRVHECMWREKENRCLNDLSLDSLARVLYTPDSYEVIPQYKVGDWVYHTDGDIGKITEINEYGTIFTDIEFYPNSFISTSAKFFRHATLEEIQKEKKRRFWDKLGRGVDEYREGDFIVDVYGDYGFIERKKDPVIYRVRMIRANQPVITHPEEMRLITQAEDRLDK